MGAPHPPPTPSASPLALPPPVRLFDRPDNIEDDRDPRGQRIDEQAQANAERTTDRRISHRPRPSQAERDAYRTAVAAEYADLRRRIFG